MSGSARSHRRTSEQPKPKRKSRKGYHFLLSCCIFFAILCACLITALVFIGKHYYYNGTDSNPARYQPPKHLLTRLPDQVLPNSYDITLKPNLESGDFKGTVNISLTVTNDTSEIILHSNRLTIGHVNLFNSTGLVVDIRDVKANPIDEIITITTKTTLVPDDYNLVIGFSGTLLNRTVGLYRSQYVDKETKTKRSIATSKFEPTYARQAFPCFDEPNKKARFKVSLLKPKDPSYIALFNMPEEGETEMEDGVMVTFQESVKMSTYLACFIVSDFKSTKDSIASKSGNIPFRVFATPAQLNKTDYARVTGKKVMEFYLDYFNIPYPLPKLDMVAIPDFVSGAMEHWGLVTFRETALLYDPDISSTTNKQRVAGVIAHELAHSWFGNLVTMDWWNDLWLNEGFASYIEYKGIHAAEPTWQMLDRFTTTDMHSVLKLDAALGSHPIVRNVETPDQITASFDAISYNKGASVLRMLENAVGEDVFQQGITNYLIKHKFDNAVTQDLLDQLQSLVSKDLNVTDFVNTWTVQMGYPILDVTKIDGGYRLTQKRFLTNDEAKSDTSEPYNYRWTIPVTYITSDSSTPVLKWFKHSDKHLDIKSNAEWIKFNSKQVGYYRVNYPLDHWQLLNDNIKNFSIPDRAHLIEESFRISEANQLPYDVPLNLSKYLKEEFEYVPWIVASRMLSQIQVYLSTSSRFAEFKNFVIGLVTPAYNHFSWNESVDDSHLRRLGRITVLRLACKADHPECLAEANKKFQRWLNGEEVLSQDLKELVYEFGMKTATKDQWEIVWSRYIDEIDAGEKVRLMGGLTSINDISVLTRLIDLAKDETYIRSQDYFSCLSSISNNPVGTSLVWDYVRENWEQLVNRFGLNERNLGRLIPDITNTFSTKTKLDEMTAFFNAYPNAGAGSGARVQALENVKNNIKWVAKNKESVESWIEKHGNQ